MNLSAVKTTIKTGNEQIVNKLTPVSILNFWQWAFSDVVSNSMRGILAEYLVALACGVTGKPRNEWDLVDLVIGNGITIEVKSSAYLQTWSQTNLYSPKFNIKKTQSSKEEGLEVKRQADVYIFALLHYNDKLSINPLDTTQWTFYVVNTGTINERFGDAKELTLKKLLSINPLQCEFEELLPTINKSFK